MRSCVYFYVHLYVHPRIYQVQLLIPHIIRSKLNMHAQQCNRVSDVVGAFAAWFVAWNAARLPGM